MIYLTKSGQCALFFFLRLNMSSSLVSS